MKKLFPSPLIALAILLFAALPLWAQDNEIHKLPEPPSHIQVGYIFNLEIHKGTSNYIQVLTPLRENEEVILEIENDFVSISGKKLQRLRRGFNRPFKGIDIHLYTTDPTKIKKIVAVGSSNVRVIHKLYLMNPLEIVATGSSGIKVNADSPDVTITCSGAADMQSNITADKLSMNFSGSSEGVINARCKHVDIMSVGSADIMMDLDADEVRINLSGNSDIILKGRANWLDHTSSGSSDLRASNFHVKDAHVVVTGSSDANVNVSGHLDVEKSGTSAVYNRH